MNKMLGNKKAILIFTLPTLIIFTLIVFYPIIQTFYRSFYDWDGLGKATFSGLENYINLFRDDLFYQSTLNGFIFAAILVTLQIGAATLLALALLNRNLRFKRFLKTSFFIPVVLSVTVVCQLWSSIYNPEFGLINHIFELMKISYRQDWLSNMHLAIYAVAFVNVWQYTGYQLAIIYGGAKAIPDDYVEAAMIDGATAAQINRKIILPMLRDTYRVCYIFAITGGLNAYAQMNLMTKGGPGTSTYTLTYMTFREAFTIGDYGYGCTAAVMLVVQCLLATVLINKLLSQKDSISF